MTKPFRLCPFVQITPLDFLFSIALPWLMTPSSVDSDYSGALQSEHGKLASLSLGCTNTSSCCIGWLVCLSLSDSS